MSESTKGRRCLIFGLCGLLGIWGLKFGDSLPAQTSFAGTASNFTMHEYYNPPNESRIKSLITGVEAQPQPNGRYLIKKLRLELYDENGKQEMIVEAPECVYDGVQRIAHSAGRIRAQTGDGTFHIEGEGFLWRQDAFTVTISNRVHTIIRNANKIAGQR